MTKKQRLIDKLTGIPRYKLADEIFRAAKYMGHSPCLPDNPTLYGLPRIVVDFLSKYYWEDWTEFSGIGRSMIGYLFLREALLSGDLDPCLDR